MIVLPHGFFCPKMIVQFLCLAINSRLKFKYFDPKFSSSRSLSTLQLQGAFWSSFCFLFLKSYLQLLSPWLAGLNLDVRNTDNHFEAERVSILDFVLTELC